MSGQEHSVFSLFFSQLYSCSRPPFLPDQYTAHVHCTVHSNFNVAHRPNRVGHIRGGLRNILSGLSVSSDLAHRNHGNWSILHQFFKFCFATERLCPVTWFRMFGLMSSVFVGFSSLFLCTSQEQRERKHEKRIGSRCLVIFSFF